MHKYTNTQIHKYTNTQIHKFTNTQIQVEVEVLSNEEARSRRGKLGLKQVASISHTCIQYWQPASIIENK